MSRYVPVLLRAHCLKICLLLLPALAGAQTATREANTFIGAANDALREGKQLLEDYFDPFKTDRPLAIVGDSIVLSVTCRPKDAEAYHLRFSAPLAAIRAVVPDDNFLFIECSSRSVRFVSDHYSTATPDGGSYSNRLPLGKVNDRKKRDAVLNAYRAYAYVRMQPAIAPFEKNLSKDERQFTALLNELAQRVPYNGEDGENYQADSLFHIIDGQLTITYSYYNTDSFLMRERISAPLKEAKHVGRDGALILEFDAEVVTVQVWGASGKWTTSEKRSLLHLGSTEAKRKEKIQEQLNQLLPRITAAAR